MRTNNLKKLAIGLACVSVVQTAAAEPWAVDVNPSNGFGGVTDLWDISQAGAFYADWDVFGSLSDDSPELSFGLGSQWGRPERWKFLRDAPGTSSQAEHADRFRVGALQADGGFRPRRAGELLRSFAAAFRRTMVRELQSERDLRSVWPCASALEQEGRRGESRWKRFIAR
jgi:hypothetical protein